MNHSQTMQIRRKRQRAEKDRAAAAKRMKRLKKQSTKAPGADAPKSP